MVWLARTTTSIETGGDWPGTGPGTNTSCMETLFLACKYSMKYIDACHRADDYVFFL